MPTTTRNRQPIPDTYDTFIEGEIVVLKTGGPAMVVIDYCENCDEIDVAYGTGKHVHMLTLPSAAVVRVQ